MYLAVVFPSGCYGGNYDFVSSSLLSALETRKFEAKTQLVRHVYVGAAASGVEGETGEKVPVDRTRKLPHYVADGFRQVTSGVRSGPNIAKAPRRRDRQVPKDRCCPLSPDLCSAWVP